MNENIVKGFKSGFVGVMGRPNVGKSTLMNSLLNQKIAIVSPKPQTTRNRVMGILTEEKFQCIFWDTPGIISKAYNKLDEYMINVSFSIPKEVDLVMYMVDGCEKFIENDIEVDKIIIKKIAASHKPIILVINKIDKLKKEFLDRFIEDYTKIFDFSDVIPISALKSTNLDKLKDKITSLLPEGPQYFSSDLITEHPERFFIAEFIREKIMNETAQEIPYSVAIKIEEVKQRTPELTYIRALIYVERDSQKGILIGKDAAMLKRIGTNARNDIADLLSTKVFLDLQVKVKKNWRKNFGNVEFMGYK